MRLCLGLRKPFLNRTHSRLNQSELCLDLNPSIAALSFELEATLQMPPSGKADYCGSRCKHVQKRAPP
jgi:hypothetical protein